MSGVREIRQTDDVHTQWILEIAGQTREFDATITEQHPDERIAWKSDAGLAVLVGCTLPDRGIDRPVCDLTAGGL